MEDKFYEVKLKKATKFSPFCIMVFIPVVIAIIFRTFSWITLSFISFVVLYLMTKYDHILYNDREVILFSPLGKRFHYSWEQIIGVYVQMEKAHPGNKLIQILNITYCYEINGTKRTETLKKDFSAYDGALEFLEFYESIKANKK